MIYIFEHRDKTIWSPSKNVAEIFLGNARHLESHLKIESGLTESMSDTIEVDFDVLNDFLLKMRDRINFNNDSMRMLVRGAVVHLLALLLCGDGTPDKIEGGYPSDWIDEARLLARRGMAMTEPIPI
jgi:hypothetical protein